MTGSTRTSADLDPRRRKLLFRSWHRGMREMDLILGQYADEYIAELSDTDLDEYERLMEVLDRDLLQWVTGEAATPEEYDTPLFRDIIAFRKRMKF
ncbi:succinate dehydrogenase assembly factor 2 [Phyllobacterium phragmitis]|uniref:FAD assembly factor SdhE n=1 Tax=Phyllobacterium phragmitis TaxID=2670329 RepID=A0A2S9ILH6_9HYPH|nr:succinate dehydrogenase assembly factor 2 [Phyllobacterium phragmitis]PRD41384.1 succinate dehydrogenase assembly factor 2 [Phyllobacterium phragmitis]